MNILANAIDAIEESSSKKTLEEIQANPYQIRISTKVTNSNTAIIKIYDSGLGISEELCARIFDPFFTTKLLAKVRESACQLAGTLSQKSTAAVCAVVRHQAKEPNLRSNFQLDKKLEKWRPQVPK